MEFYTMEAMEIMGDIMDEWEAIQEWEAYVKDCESSPWDNEPDEMILEPDEFYFDGMYGVY